MSDLEKLYEELRAFSKFKDDNSYDGFLDVVDAIIQKQDPSSIPILLSFFMDDREYGWVFESMSGAIEHYPKEVYVKELLSNIEKLLPDAISWAGCLLNSIINDPEYRKVLEENIHRAPCEALHKVLNHMQKESPHHLQFIEELRKKINPSVES